MLIEMKVDIYKKSFEKKVPTSRVSAIIPNYKYADFLPERIDSIMLQTYPVHELIILDDASPDNSVEVINKKIAEIRKEHPRMEIKLIVNKKNSGGCVFSQWQKGLKEATGDYIWIAEADDSADPHFLETAMEKMEKNSKIVLFYANSMRMNQNNKVTARSSEDWCDIWRNKRWTKDFENDGKDEIINFVSAHNTIINVSSLVWKKIPQLNQIFEEAKSYKIAGDWYIYSKVLEHGDIAYSAKPLNYYRKHDRGSVSTTINRSLEYVEVCNIQDSIYKKYKLDEEKRKWQLTRRRFMGFIENDTNHGTKGTIAWFVPDFPPKGAGGHRTIFQNINYLIDCGYKCDMYVASPESPATLMERIKTGYGEFKGDIFSGFYLVRDYDAIFATSWDSAEPVLKTDVKKKFYFIQDFEPWFFPMGTEYFKAENTYRYGFEGISIGRWLTHKISTEFGAKMNYFDFCADSSIYHPLDGVKKEDAICVIFQPFKTRRCERIALKALQIVQQKYPNYKIYLFGSAKRNVYRLKVTHLGTISMEQCNELYNKCRVGVSMSASNPSRLPFEMMAAGLPVVEIYRENNIYDLPEDSCLLAESSPEALATAIIKVIESEALQKKMSKAGIAFMKDYPIEKGFEEFGKLVDKAFSGEASKTPKIKPLYTKPAVTVSNEVAELAKKVTKDAYFDPDPTLSEYVKRGVPLIIKRGKNFTKRKLISIYRKVKK